MRPEQEYFLRRYNLPLYIFTIEDLTLLQEVVTEELQLRNSIDSKVKAIALAEKVQRESGNDQHIDDLKQDLFLARQTYAKRVSQFDDQKYNVTEIPYNNATGLPYGSEEEQEELLKPIPSPPVWEVSEVQGDGTLKHIGYSGGQ